MGHIYSLLPKTSRACLSLIALMVCLTTNAKSISWSDALRKAELYMPDKQFVVSNTSRAMSIDGKSETDNGFYIFNAEQNGGFVIVASDDRLPEILAYSAHGTLNPNHASKNVKWLLDYYTKVISSLPVESDTENQSIRSARPTIRPMITSTWGQGAPYNNMCPVQKGQHCQTGCVATALAQVINYHHWPQGQTSSIAAYKTERLGISMPQLESTEFNWDNMTNDDIARLMLYCGQAVKMDYGLDVSGAFSYMQSTALIKVFGYSQATHEIFRSSYSDEDWEDILYTEMAESRPVIYDGDSSGGGHAFILHGYNDGMFYINWGWDGYEDGYFRLTGLNTNNGDYNSNHKATIGIQSPTGHIVNRPKVVVKEVSYWGHRYVKRTSDGTFPQIEMSTKLVSDLPTSTDIQVGLGLYNQYGMQDVLCQSSHTFKPNEEYSDQFSFTLDKNLADGTYRVLPISRMTDTDDWLANANSSDYYLEISINGQWMRIRSFLLSLEEVDIEDVGVASIDGMTYSFYRKNGENCATLLCFDNGKPSGKVYVPDNVTFEGQPYLVYQVEDDVFSNCSHLTSLSVATIIAPHIEDCINLTNIELREGVCILKHTIRNCNKLVSLELPKSLSNISSDIEDCSKLQSIHFNNSRLITFVFPPKWNSASLPSLTDISFHTPYPPVIKFQDHGFDASPSIVIHVPKGTKADYDACLWRKYNIIDDLTPSNAEGMEWGYCNGDQIADFYFYDDCGNNNGEYALHVPAEMLTAYKGMTISHIQFYQPEAMCDYVFITKPGTDYIVKQEARKLENSWMDVELVQPYTITGEELYIGVGRKGKIMTYCSNPEEKVPEGFWFRTMGTDSSIDSVPGEWKYMSDLLSIFVPPIPLRFVISGDHIPTDLAVTDISVHQQENDTKQNALVTVHNLSELAANKFVLNWEIDNRFQGSETFETSLNPGRSTTVSFKIPEALEGRYHKLGYNILEVNGVADAISANSTGVIPFKSTDSHPEDGQLVVNNVTLGSDQLWWDNQDVNPGHGQDGGMGTSMIGVRYDAAIYVPAGLTGGSGTTIDGLSFFRNTLACKNVTVWISTYLPETECEADVEILDVPNNQLSPELFQYHQVAFRQPHVIPESGLYVGYSFDIVNVEDMNNAGVPFEYTNTPRKRAGSFWGKVRDDTHRTNWSDFSSNYGDLKAQILFGGGHFNQNAARIANISLASAVIGGTGKAEAILHNDGANTVQNVSLTVTGDKGQTYNVKTEANIPAYYYKKISFPLKADAQQGTDTKTVTVAQVNGHANTQQKETSAKGLLYTLAKRIEATAVLEDKTGVRYAGAPLGMTVKELLGKKYGDSLVIISPHHIDMMELDEYHELLAQTYTSVSYVNRKEPVDIYKGSYHSSWGIEKDIEDALKATVPGSVQVHATWSDEDKNGIDINTETVFGMDTEEHPFRIGLVLVEDGLCGTGPEWTQANQLSGYNYEEDPAFDKWVDMPYKIEGLSFDHVPVAAWEPYKGMEGSIPQSVKAEEKTTYHFFADIKGNIHIQNKDKLSVVALLLNKKNGTIINASKCGIDAYGTGIQSIINDQNFDVYNLQGHKVRHHVNSLNGLPKGIYIVNGKKIVK